MRILHLDIETAPNVAHVWGLWGVNVGINQIIDSGYTLCWAAKWHGKRGVEYASVHENEEYMLERMWQLLDEADAVVHYNGKKFDIPTLNKEFIINEMDPPSPYHQIDLLHVAKKRFRFPSNKLDYVAQALGLGGKVKHKGHQLWIDCMNGDDKAWRIMERYNKMDVVLLERLYERLLPWIQNHPNHALYMDTERPVCSNCGSKHVIKKGTETTQTMAYQRYRCNGCGTPLRGRSNILSPEKRKAIVVQSKI